MELARADTMSLPERRIGLSRDGTRAPIQQPGFRKRERFSRFRFRKSWQESEKSRGHGGSAPISKRASFVLCGPPSPGAGRHQRPSLQVDPTDQQRTIVNFQPIGILAKFHQPHHLPGQ